MKYVLSLHLASFLFVIMLNALTFVSFVTFETHIFGRGKTFLKHIFETHIFDRGKTF